MTTAGFSNFTEATRSEAPVRQEHMGLYPAEKWTETVLQQIISESMANQHNCWKPTPVDHNYSNTQVNDILKNGLELFDSKTEAKQISQHLERQHHAKKENGGLDHPLRGKIDRLMHEIPEVSYKNALAAFPELKGIPHVDLELMLKGVIRNELFHYDKTDYIEDKLAKLYGKMPDVGGHKGDHMTLGFTQRSEAGLKALEKEFPQQLGFLKGMETKALEDPEFAPLIVAAILAHVMKMYQNAGIKPTLENIVYGYNPDVARRDGKAGHEPYPDADTISKSSHVANVKHHMDMAKEKND